MFKDIIVIADTQVRPDVPLDHLHALARYIWFIKPAHIVHIGDNWDFESLSFFNSAKEQEGQRLLDDLEAGAKALSIIPNYINSKNAKAKKKKYKPTFDFITGNHEIRLERFINKHPLLEGIIDLPAYIKRQGWTVHEYLEPLWLEGIAFNHFMQNTQTGKPIGGGIENKLNKHPHSFVHGHQQQFQFGRRQTIDGRPHFGVCAGSFYMHDEDYRKGANTEIRGFVHLREFKNRQGFQDYDVNFISLERLLADY